jgi:1-acyl-sn-glycerol-3-phosphate acyltransferase
MAWRIVTMTGSKIVVKGIENLPKSGTTLFVANHQSYMDIPVMLSVLERPVGFVAKEEIGKIPFFDQWIVHMKCVLIARGDTRKALTAILQAAKLLQQGHSLVLYPEGTRSADGKLGEFKAGSLKAAQKGKAAIVPIAIDGARDIMPRNSFWMKKATVTLTVMPAIPAEQVQAMDTMELADLVKGQIAEALGQEFTKEAGDELHG